MPGVTAALLRLLVPECCPLTMPMQSVPIHANVMPGPASQHIHTHIPVARLYPQYKQTFAMNRIVLYDRTRQRTQIKCAAPPRARPGSRACTAGARNAWRPA